MFFSLWELMCFLKKNYWNAYENAHGRHPCVINDRSVSLMIDWWSYISTSKNHDILVLFFSYFLMILISNQVYIANELEFFSKYIIISSFSSIIFLLFPFLFVSSFFPSSSEVIVVSFFLFNKALKLTIKYINKCLFRIRDFVRNIFVTIYRYFGRSFYARFAIFTIERKKKKILPMGIVDENYSSIIWYSLCDWTNAFFNRPRST